MSKRESLAVQITLKFYLNCLQLSCRRVSRLDSRTQTSFYFVASLTLQVRFSDRYSLLFPVLNFLAFIERDKKLSEGDPCCIQRLCCSCHMSY